MSEQQPSEEELRAALEEQMRRLRVEDVLVQTAVTLVNLAGRRLGLGGGDAAERDLDQARQAIEGARALLPLLPEDVKPTVRDALSQLQMAYAQVAQGSPADDREAAEQPPPGEPGAAEPPAPGGQEPAGQAPPAGSRGAGDDERAKARSKIWTPPGS